MQTTRRKLIGSTLAAYGLAAAQTPSGVTRYARFRSKAGISWVVLEGESVRRISGDLFGQHKAEGADTFGPLGPILVKDLDYVGILRNPVKAA